MTSLSLSRKHFVLATGRALFPEVHTRAMHGTRRYDEARLSDRYLQMADSPQGDRDNCRTDSARYLQAFQASAGTLRY